jgi:hypothetical protein
MAKWSESTSPPRGFGLQGGAHPTRSLSKANAFELPFAAASFERAVAGHFYGHLEEVERARFLSEVRRVAREWVIVDAALREDVEAAAWQNRILDDGSRWRVY